MDTTSAGKEPSKYEVASVKVKAVDRRVSGCVSPVSLGLISTVVLCSAAFAETSADVQALVRQAVANEQASPFLAGNCTYQYHRDLSGRRETLQMIKSNELIVGKVVQIDNRPLSREQEQKEDDQLRHLLHDASEQQQQRKREQRFEHYVRELIQALPQAFQYTEANTEVTPEGRRLIHLAFQPAPDFHPASTELEIMQGLSGVMVVDDERRRIVKLDAHLFRDVDFGWGILVHVSKGGNLLLERDPARPPGSDVRALSLNLQGRILLLKKLETHWNFDHFAWLDRSLDLASAVSLLTAPNVAGTLTGLRSH